MGLRDRAERVHGLHINKLIYLSLSQMLVVAAIIALLSLNLAVYLGYDVIQRVFVSLWALLLLAGSYMAYHVVKKDIDPLDYIGSLVFYHNLRKRSRDLDATNTLFFFGLILITFTPFIYTYSLREGFTSTLAILSLLLGGILIALAVSGYVILGKDNDI